MRFKRRRDDESAAVEAVPVDEPAVVLEPEPVAVRAAAKPKPDPRGPLTWSLDPVTGRRVACALVAPGDDDYQRAERERREQQRYARYTSNGY